MSRQNWSEQMLTSQSAGTAIATSTTETILIPNTTIPANFMSGDRTVRVRAYGAYGTTATPALTFALRWGGVSGTVIAKTGAMVTTSGVGGGASMTATWSLEATIQVRSSGSAGTLFTMGDVILHTSTLGTAGTVTNYGMPQMLCSGATGGTTPVAVTCDLTADTALSLTALWGTSNAANSIRCDIFTVESLN